MLDPKLNARLAAAAHAAVLRVLREAKLPYFYCHEISIDLSPISIESDGRGRQDVAMRLTFMEPYPVVNP